jgi:hypothetical protein
MQPNFQKQAQENLNYYLGDHWSSWVGPTIPPTVPNAAEKLAQLERVFQSANIISECVDNWKDGLISQPFTWSLKDSKGKRVKAAEAEVELQRWLDWVNQQSIAADPATTNFRQADPWSECVLSLGVTGEGNLRLWQPRKYENDADPIHHIHLHSPKVGSVKVDRDDDGFIESIAYTYGTNKKETQQINEQGQVVVTVTDGEDQEGEPLEIDADGRWTIQQIQGPSLLTPSIKKLQNSINHALTMKLRNNELSGFRESVFLNAQAPGEWVDDPTAPGGQRFVPSTEPLERGPGIDRYVYGVPTGDPMNPTYTTPSVHESEPVAVSTFKDSIEIDRILLYLAFKQGHLLDTGDAGLSGESRIQMRQGFELFLQGWKRKVESAIANILNIVLRILGYTDLEVVVQLRITTGKLSAEEKDAVVKEFQAGLMSKATAIAKLGSVDDVDAELALIDEELSKESAPPKRSPGDNGDEELNNGTGNNKSATRTTDPAAA